MGAKRTVVLGIGDTSSGTPRSLCCRCHVRGADHACLLLRTTYTGRRAVRRRREATRGRCPWGGPHPVVTPRWCLPGWPPVANNRSTSGRAMSAPHLMISLCRLTILAATGDDAFIIRYGAEMILDTGLFDCRVEWDTRAGTMHSPRDRPGRYHEHVDNNSYQLTGQIVPACPEPSRVLPTRACEGRRVDQHGG